MDCVPPDRILWSSPIVDFLALELGKSRGRYLRSKGVSDGTLAAMMATLGSIVL